jgi:hypothetical protein
VACFHFVFLFGRRAEEADGFAYSPRFSERCVASFFLSSGATQRAAKSMETEAGQKREAESRS